MNNFRNAGGKLKAKLKKIAPKPPMAKKIAEKRQEKKEGQKFTDPQLNVAISELKAAPPKKAASKINDLHYKNLYTHWVKNTGKDQGFDAWMAEAHQVYGAKERKVGFDQWLAAAVEQKVMSCEGDVVATPVVNATGAPASSPKRILGMKASVAVPVFVAAGLLIGYGVYKYFKK